MNLAFNSNKPIFMQIREIIEDLILSDQLKEDEQVPSTNQLVNFYKLNHATVSKGVNQLVDEGILYKKRGLGVFVTPGAKEKLTEKRRKAFIDEYVIPLAEEAKKLRIPASDIIEYFQDTNPETNLEASPGTDPETKRREKDDL